ncbi:hypothetical protein [Ulvibacter antarcticus]|uniref:Uncharacterized protein n=1 Tax=Ulvibacter antarcticus TaxID=442714 RepID=A0A3L9YV27_9FLAO|nr:hypothetical protein [Ulvibacter antarcticus]RMA64373.1 hypothetical protein BXY75_1248 [Ulvibacter antarcticus]
MIVEKLKNLHRYLFVIFFVIFGDGFSQDDGISEPLDHETISEKDKLEEEQIRNVFFENVLIDGRNSSSEVKNKSSVEPSRSIESFDMVDIDKRLQLLKDNIRELQLEQQRIESLLKARDKKVVIIPEQTQPAKVLDTFSNLPIIAHAVVVQKEESPYIIVEKISQEEAEKALLAKQNNLDNNEMTTTGPNALNTNDLSRTTSYSKQIETYNISPIIAPTQITVSSKSDADNALNSNTYLLKETIDTSTAGALQIRRVYVEMIGEEQADQALKSRINVSGSTKNLELASVSEVQKVRADFNGDRNSFYAHISAVNRANESTTICFENSKCKPLVVSNTIGGRIRSLKFKGSDRDYLLFTANINDDDFSKYFLFVLRNNEWKQVMNSFAIHKSNLSSTIAPIRIDPNDPDQLLHYYSVFDFEDAITAKNPWKLKEESVKKRAW